jgi:asparagine N-glycosylation enzyme membrane subunit Stt3
MANQTSPSLSTSIFRHAGLAIILLIFVTLAVSYSLIVPLTQGEDELAHYRYIQFIAQNGRLPAPPAERPQAWYRADWPPLYHLLVGAVGSPRAPTRPVLKDVGHRPSAAWWAKSFILA